MQNAPNNQSKGFLKEMDQFGERVIFTFNGKSTMKSGTGLLSTILLFIIAVVMLLFMGQSFFFKVDPLSTTSVVNLEKMPFFNTTYDDKMFVAVRLRVTARNIAFDGKYFDYYGFRKFKTGNKEIYLIECNKLAGIDKNYIRKYELESFYCIPLNFDDFGGPGTSYENNYFSFNLSPCSNRTSTCIVPVANALASGTNFLSIDLYYPELFYDPNNFKEPIRIEHTLVTDTYSYNSTVNRELYFKTTRMNNDVGWIFTENKVNNYTTIGRSLITKTIKTQLNHPIYNLEIYPSLSFEEFTRKYQKIQDVLAVVGGFIKICQIALGSVIFYYVKYLKSEYLINGLINWQNSTNEETSKTKVINLIDEIKGYENRNSNITEKKFNTILGMSDKAYVRSLKMKDDKESAVKFIDNSGILKNENTDFFLGKHVLKPKMEVKKMGTADAPKSKTSVKKIQLPISAGIPFRYQLTLGEIFKKNLCKRLMNEKQKTRVAAFELADNYVRELLDVFGYLNLVLEVKNLKNILFNPSQKACFNFVERPTFNVPEDMNENTINIFRSIIYNSSNDFELEKKRIAEYFAYNIYSDDLTLMDQKILSGLNQQVLKVVSTKLEEMRDALRSNKMFKFNEELL
jgi:hypothetical protein